MARLTRRGRAGLEGGQAAGTTQENREAGPATLEEGQADGRRGGATQANCDAGQVAWKGGLGADQTCEATQEYWAQEDQAAREYWVSQLLGRWVAAAERQ